MVATGESVGLRQWRLERREHEVSIVVDGRQVYDWIDYSIDSSMVEPCDSFQMSRPYDVDAWETCRRDARVKVIIDGVVIVDGFVDGRKKTAKDGRMEIRGRDRAGRLVQESAPRVVYSGLTMVEVVKRLADPWFSTVVLSNARNRNVRRGKGQRTPVGKEPLVINSKSSVRIDPGQLRWHAIEELVSQAGYLAWSSADGKELVVGRPNHNQQPQYLIRHSKEGSAEKSTVRDLEYDEDNADRFSRINVVGTGGGTSSDYGSNVFRHGVVRDGMNADGTGRDFQYPKRLTLAERAIKSNAEADQMAERERARRDFRRIHVVAEMPYHGQIISGTTHTLFSPDTIARVIDEELELDDLFMVYACQYQASREGGETTKLSMVPKGTEFTL